MVFLPAKEAYQNSQKKKTVITFGEWYIVVWWYHHLRDMIYITERKKGSLIDTIWMAQSQGYMLYLYMQQHMECK